MQMLALETNESTRRILPPPFWEVDLSASFVIKIAGRALQKLQGRLRSLEGGGGARRSSDDNTNKANWFLKFAKTNLYSRKCS
jgi:hypothetical protein